MSVADVPTGHARDVAGCARPEPDLLAHPTRAMAAAAEAGTVP